MGNTNIISLYQTDLVKEHKSHSAQSPTTSALSVAAFAAHVSLLSVTLTTNLLRTFLESSTAKTPATTAKPATPTNLSIIEMLENNSNQQIPDISINGQPDSKNTNNGDQYPDIQQYYAQLKDILAEIAAHPDNAMMIVEEKLMPLAMAYQNGQSELCAQNMKLLEKYLNEMNNAQNGFNNSQGGISINDAKEFIDNLKNLEAEIQNNPNLSAADKKQLTDSINDLFSQIGVNPNDNPPNYAYAAVALNTLWQQQNANPPNPIFLNMMKDMNNDFSTLSTTLGGVSATTQAAYQAQVQTSNMWFTGADKFCQFIIQWCQSSITAMQRTN